MDDVVGGLGNAAGLLAIAEHDDGRGPRVWLSGFVGASPDFGVRRLGANGWEGLGAPFRWPTTLSVFDDGTGPRVYAAATIANRGGVQMWTGNGWLPVGQLSSARALHPTDLGAGPVLLACNEGVDQWNGTSWARVYTLPPVNTPVGPTPGVGVTMASYDSGSGTEVWVGGSFGPNADVNLVRRSAAGVWSSAGIAADRDVTALHVHDDGSGPVIIAGGSFTTIGNLAAARIARFDGRTWSTVGGPINSNVLSLATWNQGAGRRLFAGLADGRVLRLDGATWTTVGQASGAVWVLQPLASRGTLAAGGVFGSINGTVVRGAAEWNGTAWRQLGDVLTNDFPGVTQALRAVTTPAGPVLYVGGEFQVAGRVAVLNIAAFDGAAWRSLGGGLGSASSSIGSQVTAIAAHTDSAGPALFAGGRRLSVADGVVPIQNVARWDGQRWTSPGGGLPGADVLAMESYGGELFVASSATAAYGVVARWNGSTWQRADAGLGSQPWDLRVVDWGAGPQLLAGSGAGLYRWTGAGWAQFGPIFGPISAAWHATVFDAGAGPALYASYRGMVLRWVGQFWQVVGAAGGQGASIDSLAVVDDGSGPSLWATGNFISINGIPAASVARWNGRGWSAPTPPGLGDALRYSGSQLAIGQAIATLGTGIFIGGQFGSAGGTTVNGIARWDCGVAPSIAWSQAGPGAPLTITNANLVPGRSYMNLLSLDPCAGGPGTGPLLGLCASTPAALQFLTTQVALPLGTPLFHFTAATPYTLWGPFVVPAPFTLDALALDVTSGVGRASPITRIVVR